LTVIFTPLFIEITQGHAVSTRHVTTFAKSHIRAHLTLKLAKIFELKQKHISQDQIIYLGLSAGSVGIGFLVGC